MYKIKEKKVEKDISKLKADNLYDKYEEIKKALSQNPYNPPGIAKNHFGKISGTKKNETSIWHVDINQKRRVFYKIYNNEIEIEEIKYTGIVDIIQAYEHDLRRK